jgi:signal transduction histidine kinase
MVLDILYYAKERDLNWERVDVLSFVKDVALTFAPKIQSQQIEFVSDFDPSLGKFEVDAGVIRSALINILENALDACLQGKSEKTPQITFGTHHDQGHIIFDVIDNGVGMDAETREKMFTLFFSSKGHQGTGLGLFISHRIIQQHGGTIEVDSTPGQGTRMSVRIPKKLPESLKKSADQTETKK